MPRKEDLEQSIRESYSIIREYESTIQTSDRPDERLRAHRAIDRQWALIKGYLDEYRALTGNALPDDIAQIAAHLADASQARPVTLEAKPRPPTVQQAHQPAWQTYKDFILKLGRADQDTYSVEAQGPTGEARATFELPFDEKDLRIFLLEVGHSRRAAVRSRVPEPMQQTVDFGSQLYNAVLNGDVRDTFVSARHEAQREGYGLRVQLRLVDTPELADLPWEFLYDGHDFLALSPDTPVVRYLDLPRPPRPMAVDLPLGVLVTISSPHDLQELDMETEQATVCKALEAMEGRVQVEIIENVTLNALQRALRRAKREGHPYHVWHYIGHGSFDPVMQSSVLMFCDRAGLSSPVGGFQLGALFAGYPELRLAVLNACEGARPDTRDPFAGVAAALVERGVPAVVGMQDEFTNDAALAFSEEFYTALADGLPVDTAVTEARRAVFFLPNWIEWAWPVLYMRAPDGILFDVQTQAGIEREGKKAVKARERAQAGRQEQEEDGWKARETAEREIEKETQHGEEAENKARKKASPAVLTKTQPFEPEMILIPAGAFLMGSDPTQDESARINEQPQHTLYLPDYYMAKTAVTNAQYQAFVTATGQSPPGHWDGGKPPTGKGNHPVARVSWHDAMAYCRWLAEVAGKSYCLPSEAEWEKAARGTDGRIYPWGKAWDPSRCNTHESGIRDTTPVDKYPQGASPYGCLDMAGNVWEWTRSVYKSYPYEPADGREDLDAPDAVARVLRGGSFGSARDSARCMVRVRVNPDVGWGDDGFRCVVSPIS